MKLVDFLNNKDNFTLDLQKMPICGSAIASRLWRELKDMGRTNIDTITWFDKIKLDNIGNEYASFEQYFGIKPEMFKYPYLNTVQCAEATKTSIHLMFSNIMNHPVSRQELYSKFIPFINNLFDSFEIIDDTVAIIDHELKVPVKIFMEAYLNTFISFHLYKEKPKPNRVIFFRHLAVLTQLPVMDEEQALFRLYRRREKESALVA